MTKKPHDYTKDYGWRRITPTERANAIRWLDGFSPKNEREERDRIILEYFLRDNLSAQAIVRRNNPKVVGMGNRSYGKPLSIVSVLRIIYQYFPQFKNRKHSTDGNKRVELIRKRECFRSPHIAQCAFCGSKDGLEEHHMIPLFMGGTNDDENLVYLCGDCHKEVSKYQGQFHK